MGAKVGAAGLSQVLPRPTSTSMRELRRVYGIDRRKWTQLSAQFVVELTAAHTLAVSSIGRDVVWMS
jgi:hypothetical protein